ncbi:MAG: penicillin-binding protein 2 [Kiritimatiellaeota bacterium]|nr:penicillin-binding protein 2 [Kiritimatiellota bacterium]
MQADSNGVWRVWVVGALLSIALVGLSVRLSFLHWGNHSPLKEATMKKRQHRQTLPGMRGRIYDCNGDRFPMAVSLPAKRFFADPLDLKPEHDRNLIIDTVVDALSLPRKEVESAFEQTGPGSRNVKLCVSYDNDAFALLEDKKNISGIGSDPVIVRSYPQRRRMAHVIGLLDGDGNGQAGVEFQYNEHLKGAPGEASGEVDARRRVIGYRTPKYTPPIRGSDIYLTLDNNIQYEVEEALREAVENVQAVAAWAIVQDVKTGAILAMANCPDFDPEQYHIAFRELWANHAIWTMYEPGSVMKTITLAAALNERLVTPNTLISVGFGPFIYCGTSLANNAPSIPSTPGFLSVAHGFRISNNVVFAKIGMELLKPQLVEGYMRGFGFGNKLDIDLPGEAKGLIDAAKRPWQKWDKVKPTRVPIGQGISVTGLQMINAYSAIANGGKLMRPYVVDKIVSPTGEVVYRGEPCVIGKPVRPEVAQMVRELMIDVTEDGTGKKARVAGYTVAGKTGTAQRYSPEKRAYSTTEYYASFVGFIPARDPVFSVLVTVDRPAPGFARTGGAVAAPAFSKIAAVAARYLQVPPDLPNENDDGWVSLGVR